VTAFFNPWVLLTLVLAIAGAAGGGYYKGNSAGQAEVQQAWDKEKAEQYAAYAKGQEEARQREQEMQQAADRLRREKDAEIRDINARTIALSNSLRDRAERPAQNDSVSGTPRSCAGASGAELAKGDGEFLAGYSADAARLQAALDQCVKQYNAVRQK
jgi:alkanesulfonate monooxygenase SsuD/methylene tetrahydromethanopterin reductase-like flavin-dependent oxidoreductase (luciferase family)